MTRHSLSLAFGVAALAATAMMTLPAKAQDFFSALFGGFGARAPQQQSVTPVPYAREDRSSGALENFPPRMRTSSFGGGQAYCVRTCDGRYFPISATGNQTRAAACSSFCPASETRVVTGSNIDSAVTEAGKPYSELPNAFRYRDELVAGCTCNGKDTVGLASIKVEDDPTLRRGDIVAGADGLMVANRSADRRGASVSLTPAPEQIRARYRRVPVVAAQ